MRQFTTDMWRYPYTSLSEKNWLQKNMCSVIIFVENKNVHKYVSFIYAERKAQKEKHYTFNKGLANFFWKESDKKCFRICDPHGICHNYTALSL